MKGWKDLLSNIHYVLIIGASVIALIVWFANLSSNKADASEVAAQSKIISVLQDKIANIEKDNEEQKAQDREQKIADSEAISHISTRVDQLYNILVGGHH